MHIFEQKARCTFLAYSIRISEMAVFKLFLLCTPDLRIAYQRFLETVVKHQSFASTPQTRAGDNRENLLFLPSDCHQSIGKIKMSGTCAIFGKRHCNANTAVGGGGGGGVGEQSPQLRTAMTNNIPPFWDIRTIIIKGSVK